jgi:hypothetical protein
MINRDDNPQPSGLSGQHRLAQYYLHVCRLRLVMAENGTTRPSAAGLQFFKQFVAALEGLERSAPVKLQIHDGVASFTDESSGTLLAQIRISDDPNVLIGT